MTYKKTSVKLNPNTVAPTTDFLRGRFLFCIEPLSKLLQLLEAVYECNDEHKESFLKWSRGEPLIAIGTCSHTGLL